MRYTNEVVHTCTAAGGECNACNRIILIYNEINTPKKFILFIVRMYKYKPNPLLQF